VENRKSEKGFTLVEILMVVLLIGVLVTMAISQFTNFTKEAKNNSLKASLKVVRNGIATQNAQMRLRCGVTGSTWPPVANLNANDITSGATPCTTVQVPNASDRAFVSGSSLPENPWGPATGNTFVACVAPGCALATRGTNNCVGAARSNADDGWCYDPSTGEVWANSARNDGLNAATGNEYSY
jgi:prepilin-type N-terminal cleavage/methylation domain-containing protein